MFLGILEEKSKAMASALFNTFHSINTSASVLPVLKATAHKYQQRTRSQAGQITRRWRGEAKHQGGERAQDSGTQVSTERKPCSPSADITFFSYNAGTCNPWTYKPQKQQKQKKTKTITAGRMSCVAVHPLTYYHQTRQDKAKNYHKRASINQCIEVWISLVTIS